MSCTLFFRAIIKEDSYGVGAELAEQCRTTVAALEQFGRDFIHSLPPEAKATLDRFVRSRAARAPLGERNQIGARAALVALTALEAEVTFILSGRQEQIKVHANYFFGAAAPPILGNFNFSTPPPTPARR